MSGRVRSLDHLEPIGPYRIIRIDRICFVEMTWFLIHIREDCTSIRSHAYIYFHADDMFTTNSEFAINQQHMFAYLVYELEGVLFIGLWCLGVCRIQIRQGGAANIDYPILYHSGTLVRLPRLQLHKRYLILRVDRITT